MNRREAIASVVALAGAGATAHAVEQKPDESKVLFYVLTFADNFEDPTDDQLERVSRRFHEITGLDTPLVILPPGSELRKCTDIAEIPSVERTNPGWWQRLKAWANG